MCSFPFSYNQNSYNSCITNDFNFNWCSPTQSFSGQTLKCDPIGNIKHKKYLYYYKVWKQFKIIFVWNQAEPPADSCPGNLIDLNQLGLTAPNSSYNMLFTTGKNQLPVINDITVNNITLASQISIKGITF